MLSRLNLGVVLLGLALAAPVFASPVAAPQKKLSSKHHVKMIPARHNAGRPIHP